MAVLNTEVLKDIVERLPDDFSVVVEDRQGSISTLSDVITVNVSEKKLVLKLY